LKILKKEHPTNRQSSTETVCVVSKEENRNSDGETIAAHQIDLKVSTYQGTVFFEHDGESEEFEENEDTFNYLCSRTEKVLISETC
jgi:hypothetical protein